MTALGALMGFLLLSGQNSPALAPTKEVPAPPSYTVTLTAYNAVPEQTDSNPFETASGAYSNPEVVAARSQDLREELPFGTIIELDGPTEEQNSCGYSVVKPVIGYRVIADTMNARYTDRVDILVGTNVNFAREGGRVENAGSMLGICKGVTVRVVGRVDIAHMPETQAELAKLVKGKQNALAVK